MNSQKRETPTQKPNVIYFDLETQRSAEEVGGWSNIDQMRLAVAVTYSTAEGKYTTFLEADIDTLIDQLKTADLIVGFNLKRFDYVALAPYTSVALRRLPTFDMLEQIHNTLGFRVGLDSLAEVTLGESKMADGLQSLRWWKAGKVDLVTQYCQKDVEITKRIFEYACRNGHLRFTDRYGRLKRIGTSHWPTKARTMCNME